MGAAAGVTEPRYCPSPKLGGMVGEGVGCDLTLSCESGQTISGVLFADWGLPYAAASEGAALPLPSRMSRDICVLVSVSPSALLLLKIAFRQCLVSSRTLL